MFVPLTQGEIFVVVDEVSSGKFRTSDPIFSESARQIEAANVPVIVRAFSDCKAKRPICCYCRPRNAGRFFLFEHCPLLGINCISSTQIARTHPERVVIPC